MTILVHAQPNRTSIRHPWPCRPSVMWLCATNQRMPTLLVHQTPFFGSEATKPSTIPALFLLDSTSPSHTSPWKPHHALGHPQGLFHIHVSGVDFTLCLYVPIYWLCSKLNVLISHPTNYLSALLGQHSEPLQLHQTSCNWLFVNYCEHVQHV